MAFVLAVILAGAASGEALWVDELHSSWTVADGWGEIPARAAAGNQTPAYFYLIYVSQWLLAGTLGCEWGLRLPSWIAWSVSLAVGFAYLASCARVGQTGRSRAAWIACVSLLGWGMCERLQWFYASEARPYALVQLGSFLGWLCVVRIVNSRRDEGGPPRHGIWLSAWTVCAAATVHLHLTAILAVSCQWLVLVGVALVIWNGKKRGAGSLLSSVGLSGVCLAVSLLPLWWNAADVWERRSAWDRFAGEDHWSAAIRVLPFWTLLIAVPVACLLSWLLLSWLMGWLLSTSRTRDAREATRVQISVQGSSWIWLVAGVGPWLIAWLLTSLEIAPLMHSRYVVACALPMLVWGALGLMQLRFPALAAVVAVVVLGQMLVEQRTMDVWRRGELIGTLRGEDWRGASRWLSQRMEPGDQLWCAANVIEGHVPAADVDSQLSEYLSFPLRGCYAVNGIEPLGLVSNWEEWPRQWRLFQGDLPAGRVRWIVYRGTPGGFERALDWLKARQGVEVVEPMRVFGKVMVVGVK